MTVPQPTRRPTNKLTAAGIAGAVTTIGVWVAGLAGVDVAADVAAAFTTLLAVVAGYFVKDRANA
jgi:hypothetical protein